MASQPRLRDQMREVLRLTHRRFRTAEASIGWVKRFLLLHATRHPKDRGATAIRACLASLATHEPVAASTQHGARNALLFLSRAVVQQPLPHLEHSERAKRPRRLPTVCTRDAVHARRTRRTGMPHLMASLRSGAGLRRMACVRWRVQEVDLPSHHLTVRDGKGAQDRVTMLPRLLAEPLQRHLARVQRLHEADCLAGYGEVSVPYACDRQDPHAGTAWVWQ